MSIVFLLLILLLITIKNIFWGFIVLILFLLLPIRKWEKLILCIIGGLFFVRVLIDINILNSLWIKVSDNLCANLVSRAFCKLDDLKIGQVFSANYHLVESFDNIDGLVGIVKFSNIKNVYFSDFHAFLYQWISNLPLIAKQLYYKGFRDVNIYFRFILSSGIFISGGFYVLISILNKKFNQNITKYIEIVLITFLLIIFGYRFILLRKILTMCFKKYKQSIFIEMIIILFIFPTAIEQLAFIYPFIMRLVSFISFDKKYIKLKRIILSWLLQSYYLMNVNIVTLFGYNFFKYISGIYFWLAWIGFDFDIFSSNLYVINLKGQLSIYINVLIVLLIVISRFNFKKIIIIMFLFLAGYSLIYFYPYTRIIFINVGQGDSQLFISPYLEEVILLDTGKPSAYRDLKQVLDKYGIYKINQLITTHNDNDHNGNVFNLLSDYKVEYYASNKNEVKKPKIFEFDYLLMNKTYNNDNDNSIIIYNKINDFKLLFLGDASKEVERDILDEFSQKVDIIKLGHHGSKTSSDKVFLSEMCNRDCFGIISSDPKVYNHPHFETKKTLLDLEIMTLETYLDNDIVLEFRGNGLHFFTNRYKFIFRK